jgi:hypothetical protein
MLARSISILTIAGCAQSPEMMPPADLAMNTADLAPCPAGTHAGDGGACDTSVEWSAGAPAIAPARDHHATFVARTAAGDFLYVAGGTDHYASFLRSDVQRAPIGADGSVGAWTMQGSLPAPLAGMGVVVVGDTVILTGGVTGGPMLEMPAFSNRTLLAKIGADGTIAPWTQGPTFPGGREHMSLVAQDRNLYLVGGLTGNDGTTSVARAILAGDGTLGAWTAMTPLPGKRSHHASTIAGGAIYVSGGIVGGPTMGTSLDDVIRAPIQQDGTLGRWEQVSTLPAPLCVHSIELHRGGLWIFGGLEADSEFIANVRRATLNADGTLGPWQEMDPLPTARGHVLETPSLDDRIYSVGGSVADLTCLGEVVVGRYR